MGRALRSSWVLVVGGLLGAVSAHAAGPMPADFQPDPRSVQRQGPAYRYPQAGWIVLHTEGEPYERGYQHGTLLAAEIAAHVRCFAAVQSPTAPAEGWKLTRGLVNAVFLRRFEKEYLEEMKGIAEGAAAGGARFDNRAIDLVDIAALNAWPEIGTLDAALHATPTGLEDLRFPTVGPRTAPPPQADHCSAFAATGPATADGKIVFGHITMFGLYPSNFYNVWLDLKPAKGHRVLMQTFPGGIQSGLDYYMNDAGLLVCETTIRQTRFDAQGTALASRIRQALQYADSIDRAVALLKEKNNGLYTNEWLLADTKTNEIAMFELGTHKSKLYRSSKQEWFGGTEGFYWGCNNTKDLDVRLETLASTGDRPANVVFRPSERDRVWLRLYNKYRGKIGADFAREAFTTAPIAAYHSLDAKFTTTALASELKTWALFGPPLGRTWEPTPEERQRYPEVRPLVSNPWAMLHAGAPAKVEGKGPAVVDLQSLKKRADGPGERAEDDRAPPAQPVWHGTLLPKTDADTWLAAAFADYEHVVALEKGFRQRGKDNALAPADRERLGLALFGYRSSYLTAIKSGTEAPLTATRAELVQDDWYRVAAGKGALLLHELRRVMGEDAFVGMMESFGRANAGKEVTTAQFQAHVEKAAGKRLDGFFAYWLDQKGLPHLELSKVNVAPQGTGFRLEGEILRSGPCAKAPAMVDVVVRTAAGDVTKSVSLDSAATKFTVETSQPPLRLTVDPYGDSARTNGGPFSVLTFGSDLEHTLIVYGTADEVPTNREAAQELQRAIIQRGSNFTVPIKSDREAADDDLKGRHLLLIGRPDSNTIVARYPAAVPVRFDSRSFVVGEESYAHMDSAVIAAGANPLDARYSVVVIAGLSASSTRNAALSFLRRGSAAGEVLILANGKRPRALVLPARELVRDFVK